MKTLFPQLSSNPRAAYASAIGLGIVFAALFFWVRNEMVIISTSVTGATFVGRGVGELFGWRSGLEGVVNQNPAWLTILVFAVGIVVFIAGLLYQWRAYARLHWYDVTARPDPSKAVPSAAASAQSYATRATTNIDAAAGAAGSTVTGGGAAVAGVASAAAVAATLWREVQVNPLDRRSAGVALAARKADHQLAPAALPGVRYADDGPQASTLKAQPE